MHTSKFVFRSQKQSTGKSSLNRGVLVKLLCSLLCIMGAVTYNSDASTKIPLPMQHLITAGKDATGRSTNTWSSRRQIHSVPHKTQQNTRKPLDYPVYFGNPHTPEIALTFDDGPNPIYTSQILAILHANKIKATFFDVGYLVREYPDIVRQEFLQGHSIGNHSWSHPELSRLSTASIVSQLVSTSDAIQSVTGTRPTIFRPPYGSFNRIVLSQAMRLNLSTIIWNDEARDWTTPGVYIIVRRILNLARNGGIILLHDGGGFRAQTVAALPLIITSLRQRGFTFVTIPQLLLDMAPTRSPSPTASLTDISNPAALTPAFLVLQLWGLPIRSPTSRQNFFERRQK